MRSVVYHSVFFFSPLQRYHRDLIGFCTRRLRSTTSLHHKESIVFPNSLERTLEAHRTSNRAGLIRKVPSKDVSEETRSLDPAFNNASAKPSFDTQAPLLAEKRKPRKNRHRAVRPVTCPPGPTSSWYPHIKWDVNVSEGRLQQSPWLEHLEEGPQLSDGLSRLDAEIRALQRYLTPTLSEQHAVSGVVAEISSLLGGVVPQTPLVVGSRRTGFALSHSDLDFVLPVADEPRSMDLLRRPSPSRPQVLGFYSEILRKVQDVLDRCPSFGGRVHIFGKWNAALSAIHHPTGLEVQLYCGEQLPAAVDYHQDYNAEYPTIRPLYMVVRLILETQGVYGSHTSGIGPDALLILLVTFLRLNHGRFRQPKNLDSQLLAILRFYGTEIDLTATGVSADPPCFFNVLSIKEAMKNYDPENLPAYLRGQRSLISLKKTAVAKKNTRAAEQLCLQDPANYMNDLGRGYIRTREVQAAFARAYERLRISLDAWGDTMFSDPSPSILSPVLKANFEDFNRMRTHIAASRG